MDSDRISRGVKSPFVRSQSRDIFNFLKFSKNFNLTPRLLFVDNRMLCQALEGSNFSRQQVEEIVMPALQKKERRQCVRVPIKKGVVALLNLEDTPIITRLLDINSKGLAFSYTSLRKLPKIILDIDVLFPHVSLETDIYLGKIRGRIITAHDLVRRAQTNTLVTRRYGLEFQELHIDQQTCLNDYFEKVLFP